MAPRVRTLQRDWSTAILLAVLTTAPTAWADPALRPAARVSPVARVDLGAPDPRCTDLAYPLWDDGMCVRAKCADDDACDFSKVAGARAPASPVGLTPERWRTATARPVTSTYARGAATADSRNPATQLARAKDNRRTASVPLLAEARAASPLARSSDRRTPPIATKPTNAAKPDKAAERPSIWRRFWNLLNRLWQGIETLGRLIVEHSKVLLARSTV